MAQIPPLPCLLPRSTATPGAVWVLVLSHPSLTVELLFWGFLTVELLRSCVGLKVSGVLSQDDSTRRGAKAVLTTAPK